MNNKIALRKLTLKNFKGIKDLVIDFSKLTNIKGENATGKTSIFDSFTWLLFDKDSQDRSKFEVQPLDSDNKVVHMVDTEVEGTLDVNGKNITLKKVLKEKWTRKRGEEQAELKGTETSYYIDEVPVKMSEYKAKINELIDENLFKLLSNPLYFSTNMKWQDRRKVLLDIIGDITAEKVIDYKNDLKTLGALLIDKDIDTFKKQVQARKKKLSEDKKSIPSRVDECNRSIKDIDFDAIEFRKRGVLGAIKSLEEQLMDSSKMNEEILKEKDKLYSMKTKLRDMEYKAKTEADKPFMDLKMELHEAKNNLEIQDRTIRTAKRKIEQLEKSISDKEAIKIVLKEKWHEENKKIFEMPSDSKCCPTCRREYEAADIEIERVELEGNFNEDKARNLYNISSKGKALNVEIEEIKEEIAKENITELEAIKSLLENRIKDLEFKTFNYEPIDNLKENIEYQALKSQISELDQKLQQPTTVNSQVQDLRERKFSVEKDLEEVNELLTHKKTNEELRSRISELMEEEKRISQQIAELEGQEYLCEEFIKTKVELLEGSINKKFRYVTFKLFETQVNGGINECCEALVSGIPFGSANTAGQINAGLDIINTLSEHYKVEAPIFIDNRESINQLIETDSQVINLIVSLDKKLNMEVM